MILHGFALILDQSLFGKFVGGSNADKNQQSRTDRQHDPHVVEILQHLGSVGHSSVLCHPIRKKQDPTQPAEDDVDDHIKSVANALNPGAIIVGFAHLKAQRGVRNHKHREGGFNQNVDDQQIPEERLLSLKRLRHKPHKEKQNRKKKSANQHIRMAPPEAAVSAISNGTHQRVGHGIIESGGGKRGSGQLGTHPHHLSIKQHGKIPHPVHGDRGGSLPEGIPPDIAQFQF